MGCGVGVCGGETSFRFEVDHGRARSFCIYGSRGALRSCHPAGRAQAQLDDIQTLVGAIIQAEQMRTSLASILRAQAQRLRVRRRQRAEQEARRAQLKMVFPLVFCLMPLLFSFILGPLVVSVVDFLAGQ